MTTLPRAFRVETPPLPITVEAATELVAALVADPRVTAAGIDDQSTRSVHPAVWIVVRGATDEYVIPDGFEHHVAAIATEACEAAGFPYRFAREDISYARPWWTPADNMIGYVEGARKTLAEIPPEHRAPLAVAIENLETATWDIEAIIDPASAAARRVAMTEVVEDPAPDA